MQFMVSRSEAAAGEITALTPDASTREYFRVPWGGSTAVAAVYAEEIDPSNHSFLDVATLFREAGLPVPALLAVDPKLGVIVQEDLGDRQLRDVLDQSSSDEAAEFTQAAIRLIARIQAATQRAYELGSIASRLAFDEEKLSWELDFFYRHYFSGLRCLALSTTEEDAVRADLTSLARELADCPRVLCHRDFHVANLMVDKKDRLHIVDFQDARMGPASYDLVSLLLDRRSAPPPAAETRNQRLFFLEERVSQGLPAIDPDDFAREFRFMTVQRGLKAVGTFANQTLSGRGHVYGQFIYPTLAIVSQSLDWLGRFDALREVIERCMEEAGSPTE